MCSKRLNVVQEILFSSEDKERRKHVNSKACENHGPVWSLLSAVEEPKHLPAGWGVLELPRVVRVSDCQSVCHEVCQGVLQIFLKRGMEEKKGYLLG